MQIHVVQEGESLYSIANRYSVQMDEITITNELEEPVWLVVGQALVIPIPGKYYFVREGDTLPSIAYAHNRSVRELSEVNDFPFDEPLPKGLRLYIPPNESE